MFVSLIERTRRLSVSLTHADIWVVAVVVGASMVVTRLLPVAVVVIAVFWLIRWLANGYLTLRTPADWAIALIALMVPITIWATSLPETTHPQVYRILTGIGFYYAIINWTTSNDRLHLLIIGTALAGLGLAIFGLVSVEWMIGKVPFIPATIYDLLPTLIPDKIHRNVMAGSLVIILPCILAVLLFTWRELNWLQRIFYSISAIAMVGVLFLTQSRGGWIAFTLVIIILALLRGKWGWLVLLVTAISGATLIYLLGIETILEMLVSSKTLGGVDGRINTWSRAVYMIQDFPFTGIGLGSFKTIADTFYPFSKLLHGTVEHAHNLYLQVAVDLGITGLIAWMAILWSMTVTAWQVYKYGRRTQNGWCAGLGAGLLCSQVALATHGVIDAVTWGMVRPAPIVWALWGLTVSSAMVCFLPQLDFELSKTQ